MATIEERLAALEAKLGGSDEVLYNSAHTGEQIDKAVTSVQTNEATWSGKAEKAGTATLILSVDGWDKTLKTQTLTDPLLEASSAYRYFIGNAMSDRTAFILNPGITVDDITTTGQITFHCEAIPDADLTVEIVRMEVKHE